MPGVTVVSVKFVEVRPFAIGVGFPEQTPVALPRYKFQVVPDGFLVSVHARPTECCPGVFANSGRLSSSNVLHFKAMNPLVSKGFRIFRDEGFKGIYSRFHRTASCADGFDETHNIETGEPIPIWKLGKLNDLSEASPYQAITLETFDEMMQHLPVRPEAHTFVDLGCGKGKALILALERGFKKAVGVEFSYTLCAASMMNLSALGMRGRSEIVLGSASEYRFPEEPTVIFMFNPFGPKVLREVLQHIPPGTFLAYAHPKHADLIPFPCLYRSHDLGIWFKAQADLSH